jgi:hypothetical protein
VLRETLKVEWRKETKLEAEGGLGIIAQVAGGGKAVEGRRGASTNTHVKGCCR